MPVPNTATGVEAGNTARYAYDANGNQVLRRQGGETTRFGYDARDQLSAVGREGAGGELESVSRYRYDYRGLRRQKQTLSGTLNYVYDAQSVLLQTDAGHETVARYEYGPDRLLAVASAVEGRQFYLFDALGSVVNLTTAPGTGTPTGTAPGTGTPTGTAPGTGTPRG